MVLDPTEFLPMICRLPKQDWGEAYLSAVESCKKYDTSKVINNDIWNYVGQRIKWALLDCQRKEYCIRYLDQNNKNKRRIRAEHRIDPYILQQILKKRSTYQHEITLELNLDKLTIQQQFVVHLRLRGLTFKQTAVVYGCTRDNVRQIWWKAIETLKTHL